MSSYIDNMFNFLPLCWCYICGSTRTDLKLFYPCTSPEISPSVLIRHLSSSSAACDHGYGATGSPSVDSRAWKSVTCTPELGDCGKEIIFQLIRRPCRRREGRRQYTTPRCGWSLYVETFGQPVSEQSPSLHGTSDDGRFIKSGLRPSVWPSLPRTFSTCQSALHSITHRSWLMFA